jgi:hypothetical protein
MLFTVLTPTQGLHSTRLTLLLCVQASILSILFIRSYTQQQRESKTVAVYRVVASDRLLMKRSDAEAGLLPAEDADLAIITTSPIQDEAVACATQPLLLLLLMIWLSGDAMRCQRDNRWEQQQGDREAMPEDADRDVTFIRDQTLAATSSA